MTREDIFNNDAPALYDGGWRSSDRTQLIKEYELTEDEADMMCEALEELEHENTWYAVLMDKDDNDWGTGSHDKDEAFQMARDMDAQYVAVIDNSNDPICTEILDVQ